MPLVYRPMRPDQKNDAVAEGWRTPLSIECLFERPPNAGAGRAGQGCVAPRWGKQARPAQALRRPSTTVESENRAEATIPMEVAYAQQIGRAVTPDFPAGPPWAIFHV